MALSFEQFQGDGTNRQFPIDFGYLSRDHISVSVDGVEVAFIFLTSGMIQTAVAPAAGTVVEVRRTTPREEPLTDFVDGSTLTESDLDTATLQTFYLAQEAYDIAGGTLGIQPDGSYSANNRRIGTAADPVGPQDVVNKRYFEGTFLPQQTALLGQTTAQKELGVAARLGAETALAAALAARDLAVQYRDAALTHRNAAEAAQTGAQTARTGAETARTGAETAKAGADTAKAGADTAKSGAEAARDTALLHRDSTYTAEQNALTYRNTTLTYRNDAETFKNQAAASAAEAALFDPTLMVRRDGSQAMTGPLVLSQGGKISEQSAGGAGGLGRTLIWANNNSLDIVSKDGNSLIFSATLAGSAPVFKTHAMWHAGNLAAPWHSGNLLATGRNYVINGCFRINQRGASGGVSSGGYLWDRWFVLNGSSFTVSAAYVATLNGTMQQPIEEPNLAGKVVTISVEDPSANITVGLGTYDWTTANVTGVIAAGSGRRSVTLTVPGAATSHVQLRIITAASTTFKNVQLERGPTATEFEWRHRGHEAALCQRYYAAGSSYHLFGAPNNTFGDMYRTQFPVSMRTVPTLNYSYYATNALSSYATYLIAVDHFDLGNFATHSTNVAAAFTWNASAEL